jgi:hypothetical protein
MYLPCPLSQACELKVGDEIVLLYWPPTVTSRDICALDGYGSAQTIKQPQNSEITVTMNAIAFRGKDLYHIPYRAGDHGFESTVEPEYFTGSNIINWMKRNYIGPSTLHGNWTFTSPSVYLAHHPITAWVTTQSTPPYTTSSTIIRGAGVIPLNPKDVFSLYPVLFSAEPRGTDFAKLVAEGKFKAIPIPTWGSNRPIATAQFDFGDLQNPVPASIYFNARYRDCWGRQTHCGTITDDAYRPEISINNKVWSSIIPPNLRCRLPVLVDPPIALSRLEPGNEPSPAGLPSIPRTSSNPGDDNRDGGSAHAITRSPQAQPGSRAILQFAHPTATPYDRSGGSPGSSSWGHRPQGTKGFGVNAFDFPYPASSNVNSGPVRNGHGAGGINEKADPIRPGVQRGSGSGGAQENETVFQGGVPDRVVWSCWKALISIALVLLVN